MHVSKAVKMLRKKTVTYRDIRMKLACLAVVSSVSPSTNLKMKMLKEHVELLGDIDDFFAFPWGRLAFDMLMTNKEATLSPSHVRDVDKKEEVLVRSTIPQDPEYPVNESLLVWSYEVEDGKVENLVKLISANHVFSKMMFKGGAIKTNTGVFDESKISFIVFAILKPEVERIGDNIASALSAEKVVSSSALMYQSFVLGVMESMLKSFKEEMLSSGVNTNTQFAAQTQHTTPQLGVGSMAGIHDT
ncbi:hypothetical protein N665_2025s0002 [Sinapis alba]|nr:hypothetical protein N665_2025s0002 [Sinapis alba]